MVRDSDYHNKFIRAMNAIDNKKFKDFIGHSKVSPIAPDEFIKLIDQR